MVCEIVWVTQWVVIRDKTRVCVCVCVRERERERERERSFIDNQEETEGR